jgi:CheY-specific phosphatase CheX
MLNQYFGQYLLNKGILTHIQLREVLQSEQIVKVKLGVLAVNAGLMTAAQVEDVHNLQWVKDQKFGALAIQQGYLTSEQVDQLLESQQEGHLTIMQAITDKGYMTLAAVEKALADFRGEYGITGGLHDTDNEDEVIKKLVDFSAAGDKADLLYNYVGLIRRNVVRFLNDTPFIFTQITEHEQNSRWLASQQIIGDVSLSTGLLMDESVLLEIASRFYGERLPEVVELALDSVGEFLNVHNGVFCSLLSDAGTMVDLQPPFVMQSNKSFQLSNYCVTVGTSFGKFEIILSLKE